MSTAASAASATQLVLQSIVAKAVAPPASFKKEALPCVVYDSPTSSFSINGNPSITAICRFLLKIADTLISLPRGEMIRGLTLPEHTSDRVLSADTQKGLVIVLGAVVAMLNETITHGLSSSKGKITISRVAASTWVPASAFTYGSASAAPAPASASAPAPAPAGASGTVTWGSSWADICEDPSGVSFGFVAGATDEANAVSEALATENMWLDNTLTNLANLQVLLEIPKEVVDLCSLLVVADMVLHGNLYHGLATIPKDALHRPFVDTVHGFATAYASFARKLGKKQSQQVLHLELTAIPVSAQTGAHSAALASAKAMYTQSHGSYETACRTLKYQIDRVTQYKYPITYRASKFFTELRKLYANGTIKLLPEGERGYDSLIGDVGSSVSLVGGSGAGSSH